MILLLAINVEKKRIYNNIILIWEQKLFLCLYEEIELRQLWQKHFILKESHNSRRKREIAEKQLTDSKTFSLFSERKYKTLVSILHQLVLLDTSLSTPNRAFWSLAVWKMIGLGFVSILNPSIDAFRIC